MLTVSKGTLAVANCFAAGLRFSIVEKRISTYCQKMIKVDVSSSLCLLKANASSETRYKSSKYYYHYYAD